MKQYITISSITVSNASATLGFMFVNTPKDNFEVSDITVSQMTANYIGCLYVATIGNYNVSFSDFTCQDTTIKAASYSETQQTTNQELAIGLKDMLVSGCFVFDDAKDLVIENFVCSSPTVYGLGSLTNPTISDPSIKVKAGCLYTLDVDGIKMPNFECTFAQMRSMLTQYEDPFLLYFENLIKLTLDSGLFEGNNAANSFFINGGQAYISNTNFTNNTASDSDTGSAIMANSNVNLEIKDSVFYNNTCNGCSGALNVQTGKLTLSNVTFMYNQADDGAAVYASLATVDITTAVFKWNTAKETGSAVSFELCTTKMSECSIEENTVTSGEASVYIYEGEATISNSNFTKNYADRIARNLQVLDADSLSVSNCYFTDDENNKLATFKGSMLFVRNTLGTVEDSIFTNARGSTGGAVYLNLKEIKTFGFENVTFDGCYADNQGEAIYAEGVHGSVVTIKDSTFSCGTPSSMRKNRNDLSAMYCQLLTCQLSGTTFYPKGATDSGNQLYIYKGYDHSLNNVNFTADCETLDTCDRSTSSAFRLSEVESATITGSTFTGWGADDSNGGAVKLDFPSSKAASKTIQYTFTNCIWTKNQAKNGGAIYAEGVMNVTVNGATFQENSALDDGGAIYWNSTSTSSNFIITGTGSFEKNVAGANGGAYRFPGRIIDFSGASFTFTDNTAAYGNDKAGYAVYAELITDPDPSLYTAYVESIKEKYNIARLLSQSGEHSNRMLTTYASGEYIEPPMVMKIYDEFGQHVVTDSSSTIQVNATASFGSTPVVDGNPFTAQNGYVILYPLTVKALPGSTVTFSFSLTSFKPTSYGRTSSDFTGFSTSDTDSMYLRECVKGERRSDDNTCSACESTKYTLVFNSTDQCKDCPDGGICEGYDNFGPDANYFKLSYSTNLVVGCYNDEACLGAILDTSLEGSMYCAEINPDDSTFCYTGWCAAGYTGHMCGECQDGYAYKSVDDKTCSTCTDNPNYYLYSAGIGIGGTIYIIIMIRGALKEEKDEKKDKKDEKDKKDYKGKKMAVEAATADVVEKLNSNGNDDIVIEAIERVKPTRIVPITLKKKVSSIGDGLEDIGQRKDSVGKKPEDGSPEEEEKASESDVEDASDINLASFYLKIFTDYVQLVSIIGTFSFEWPDELTNLFSAGEDVHQSSSEIFSFDCMLRQPMFVNMGLSSFFSKLLVMAISPIGFAVVIIGVWYLIYAIKYKCRIGLHKKKLHTNIITSLVVCIFILHPTITELSTQSFKCVQLGDDDGDLYLEGNLEVKCWESTHLKWAFLIGLPSLIVWGLGIPCATLFLLKHYKKDLHKESMKAKFGFLYEGYFARAYFWEFVIFYRKMVLIVISVFMSAYSTNIQGAIVIGISCINYVFLMKVKPYLHETLNEMEKRSLIASATTIYGGLFYLTSDLGSAIKIFFFVAIIIINAYFYIYLAIEYLRAKATELQKNKFINKHFGKCLLFFINFEWRNLKKQRVVPINSEKPNLIIQSLDDKEFGSNVYMLGAASPSMSPFSQISPKAELFSKANSFRLKLQNTNIEYQGFSQQQLKLQRPASMEGAKSPISYLSGDLFSDRPMTGFSGVSRGGWEDQKEERMRELIAKKKKMSRIQTRNLSNMIIAYNKEEENPDHQDSMQHSKQTLESPLDLLEDHSKEVEEVEEIEKIEEEQQNQNWEIGRPISMRNVQPQQSVQFLELGDPENPLFDLGGDDNEEEERQDKKGIIHNEVIEEEQKSRSSHRSSQQTNRENSKIFKVDLNKSDQNLLGTKEDHGTMSSPQSHERSHISDSEGMLANEGYQEEQLKDILLDGTKSSGLRTDSGEGRRRRTLKRRK